MAAGGRLSSAVRGSASSGGSAFRRRVAGCGLLLLLVALQVATAASKDLLTGVPPPSVDPATIPPRPGGVPIRIGDQPQDLELAAITAAGQRPVDPAAKPLTHAERQQVKSTILVADPTEIKYSAAVGRSPSNLMAGAAAAATVLLYALA